MSVRLASASRATLEALRLDFEYFESEARAHPGAIRLTLVVGRAPRPASGGRRVLITRDFSAKDAGSVRRIDYADGATALYDFEARRGWLYCERAERLHELAYLAVLSRAGEELDRAGLHRVHALGFALGDSGGLLLLPSGGGKSTLALELVSACPSLRVLSDDTPLLDAAGRLRAFPLRWGFAPSTDLARVPEAHVRPFERLRFGPKKLVNLGFFRDRVAAEAPLRWLIVGRRSSRGKSRVEPMGRAAALKALLVNLVIGHGVAQMAEYRLRPSASGVAGLCADALARAKTALAASRASLLLLTVAGAPADTAKTLLEALG